MRRLLLGCLFIVGCGAAVLTPNYLADPETGAPVMWSSYAFPLPVYVDESMSPANREAIEAAVLQWNDAVGQQVFSNIVYVTWDEAENLRDRRNVIVVIEENLKPDNVLGLTYYTTGRTETDRLFWAHVYLDPAISAGCHERVAVHELGHALGLAHDESRQSVMYEHACSSEGHIMTNDVEHVLFQLP